MKFITKIIHSTIRWTHTDNFLAGLSARSPIFQKLIPIHTEFHPKTYKCVERDEVRFELDVSDYMQWYVYAQIKDFSWIHARNLLRGKPNPIVLDIGANIGAFSLKLAQSLRAESPDLLVHSFEPSRHIADRLRRNLSLNPSLQNNVIVEECAIGDKDATIPFIVNQVNSGGSNVWANVNSTNVSETYDVMQTSVDNYVAKRNIDHVSFIKIDVEGYEPFVFDGALETINTFKPAIYLEITPEWFGRLGRHVSDITSPLLKLGYTLYYDEVEILTPYETDSEKSHSEQFNILAVHDDIERKG